MGFESVSDVTRFNVPDILEQQGALTAAELIAVHKVEAKPEFLERALMTDASGKFGPTALSEV